MIVEYERSIDDHVEFNLFHMAHSPSTKRQLLIARIVAAVVIIPLIPAIYFLNIHKLTPVIDIIGILAGAVVFFVFPSINRTYTIRRLYKILKEGDNKAIIGKQVIRLSPDGILTKSPVSESKIAWSSVERIVQSDKHIYLYISSINAYMIPKTAFSSEKQQQEFLEYVSAHLEQKK